MEMIEVTEADIRGAVERYGGQVAPGVSNETVIANMAAAFKGKLNLKDAHGFTDDSMEAVYSIAYNLFQAGRFDEAQPLFQFLCMFDHMKRKYWMALGACRFAQKNYADAAGTYIIAGMYADNDPAPPLRAADCFLAAGNVGQAIETLTQGIKLCGGDAKHADAKKRAQSILELLEKEAKKAARDADGN